MSFKLSNITTKIEQSKILSSIFNKSKLLSHSNLEAFREVNALVFDSYSLRNLSSAIARYYGYKFITEDLNEYLLKFFMTIGSLPFHSKPFMELAAVLSNYVSLNDAISISNVQEDELEKLNGSQNNKPVIKNQDFNLENFHKNCRLLVKRYIRCFLKHVQNGLMNDGYVVCLCDWSRNPSLIHDKKFNNKVETALGRVMILMFHMVPFDLPSLTILNELTRYLIDKQFEDSNNNNDAFNKLSFNTDVESVESLFDLIDGVMTTGMPAKCSRIYPKCFYRALWPNMVRCLCGNIFRWYRPFFIAESQSNDVIDSQDPYPAL